MDNATYAKKCENSSILLTPKELVNQIGPNGISITTVTFSRTGVTFHWFIDFLEGTKDSDEFTVDEKTYQVSRNSNNIYLKETRGSHVNIVGFTSTEIPYVLKQLREIATVG